VRVLVTGGTGFIGANLVRQLLERGDEVRCLIRKPNLCLEGLDVSLHKVALDDEDGLATLMDGCEGVYHVAGIFDPSPGGEERMHQVHVEGTRALGEAAVRAGVRRMVLCSSSITVGFGSRAHPGNEETWLDAGLYGHSGALRAYHDTKLASEKLVRGWTDIEGVVVNPDFIIGAWDVKPTSGQLIVSMARGWMPAYPRGGKCFQDADACALGHILAMDQGRPGERYLLGSHNLSYREFMDIVAEVIGCRKPLMPIPDIAVLAAGMVGRVGSRIDAHRFAGLDGHVLRAMQQERYRDGTRSHEELGVPQVPMHQAVEKAYQWFRDRDYC
jgi:dihydroflavonol-4-reductase